MAYGRRLVVLKTEQQLAVHRYLDFFSLPRDRKGKQFLLRVPLRNAFHELRSAIEARPRMAREEEVPAASVDGRFDRRRAESDVKPSQTLPLLCGDVLGALQVLDGAGDHELKIVRQRGP